MKPPINVIVFVLALCTAIQIQAQETREITARIPGIDAPQTITVTVRNGKAFWCEDMCLGPIEQFTTGRGGGAVAATSGSHNYRWPNGVIPYELPATHPKVARIRRAIDTINAKTNLQLRVKTSTDQYWVRFANRSEESFCWSDMGRQPLASQPQTININEGCDWGGYGSVMHEILHAAGLFHEQKRSDRNTCITINATAYAALTADWKEQWNTLPAAATSLSPTYDLTSIMHYPAGSPAMFTVNPACTTGLRLSLVGQRQFLSHGDITFVNSLYPRTAGAVGRSAAAGAAAGAAGTAGTGGRGGAADASSSFDVRYNVQLVPQPTSMSCWASSAAMIYGWLRNVRVNVDDIRNAVGVWRNFPEELRTGLNVGDVRIFRNLHFCCEPPVCYTVEGFRGLLEDYGPLWIAASVPGAHVRVAYGIYGDGTPDGTRVLIHDPWGTNLPTTREPTRAELEANRGQSYERTFTDLMAEMEKLGAAAGSVPNAVFVVHAPAAGGGACSCGN